MNAALERLEAAMIRLSPDLIRGAMAAALTVAPLLAGAAARAPLNPGLGPPPPAVARDTPRAMVVGYLEACRSGDLTVAAHYLNLAAVAVPDQQSIGARRARRLKIVLDRSLGVDPAQLSDDPLGNLEDGLAASEEELTTLSVGGQQVELLLETVELGDGRHAWVIHRATVELVDRLYAALGLGWLGDHLPEVFFAARLWQVQLWQLCALLVLGAVSWGLARLLAWPLLAILRRAVRRTTAAWDDALAEVVAGPLRWGLALALLAAAASRLGLAPPVAHALQVTWRLATVLILGWLASAWIKVGAQVLERSVAPEAASPARGFIPIFTRVAKLMVWALVVVVCLDAVGVRVMALVAGLGIGGLAVAFAAQKTIENFFGAVSIATDRPFVVGDFVGIGGIVGTVEEVGLRCTRLRTVARTVVTIPNGSLLSERVENYSARDRIVYQTSLGLVYGTTPAQIELLIDEVKKLLLSHPRVDHDLVRVRHAGFGESCIKVELFTAVTTTDFHEYSAVAEQLNLELMRVVERVGTAFALPSRTVYAGGEAGLDGERARQAEATVADRRGRGELWLPEPPPPDQRRP